MADRWNIQELADGAGLSRRAVRFYVQQGLLPPPVGLGRGAHYEPAHLDRLKRIIKLQAAGHSLDAVRLILEGKETPPPPPPLECPRRPPAKVTAELWTRLRIGDGVELHFDATRHNPDVEQLIKVRQAVQRILSE
jgi:DNA-binding transcriptional MerR regulator